MKTRAVWGGIGLAFLALLGACSKSNEADNLPPMEFEGVKVDTPRLMAEFVEAAPELQKPVNDAVTNLRYRKYLEAMKELDGVLKNPGLTEKQKKLVTQVLDQLKEVIAKPPPRPGQ